MGVWFGSIRRSATSTYWPSKGFLTHWAVLSSRLVLSRILFVSHSLVDGPTHFLLPRTPDPSASPGSTRQTATTSCQRPGRPLTRRPAIPRTTLTPSAHITPRSAAQTPSPTTTCRPYSSPKAAPCIAHPPPPHAPRVAVTTRGSPSTSATSRTTFSSSTRFARF
jgi:hypothetical protein